MIPLGRWSQQVQRLQHARRSGIGVRQPSHRNGCDTTTARSRSLHTGQRPTGSRYRSRHVGHRLSVQVSACQEYSATLGHGGRGMGRTVMNGLSAGRASRGARSIVAALTVVSFACVRPEYAWMRGGGNRGERPACRGPRGRFPSAWPTVSRRSVAMPPRCPRSMTTMLPTPSSRISPAVNAHWAAHSPNRSAGCREASALSLSGRRASSRKSRSPTPSKAPDQPP